MFEQAFKNIDDVLRKEAGCTTELDYTEQTSWILFLKYLDNLEQDKATEAQFGKKPYTYILDEQYRWEQWNSRDLFESYLQDVHSRRGDGWVEKKLSEVTESISTGPFGTMLHKSDYVPEGIPLVNPMNIVNSRIVASSRMMVSEKTRERLRAYKSSPPSTS